MKSVSRGRKAPWCRDGEHQKHLKNGQQVCSRSHGGILGAKGRVAPRIPDRPRLCGVAGDRHVPQPSLEEAEGADEEDNGAVGGVRVDLRDSCRDERDVGHVGAGVEDDRWIARRTNGLI